MTASGATSSAARWAAPSSATSCSSSAATRARSCVRRRRATFRTCRRPRCSRATSRRSRRRRASGRQINLSAPFVGNRINPALFSPAALNFTAKLPQSTDPCGEVQWETADRRDIHEPIVGSTSRRPSSQLFFGRYLVTKHDFPAPWEGPGDNLLKTSTSGTDGPAPARWFWVRPTS